MKCKHVAPGINIFAVGPRWSSCRLWGPNVTRIGGRNQWNFQLIWFKTSNVTNCGILQKHWAFKEKLFVIIVPEISFILITWNVACGNAILGLLFSWPPPKSTHQFSLVYFYPSMDVANDQHSYSGSQWPTSLAPLWSLQQLIVRFIVEHDDCSNICLKHPTWISVNTDIRHMFV